MPVDSTNKSSIESSPAEENVVPSDEDTCNSECIASFELTSNGISITQSNGDCTSGSENAGKYCVI